METASDQLITETEKELARKALSQLCAEACTKLSDDEAKLTAKAVYHDAVSAAAKDVALAISEESLPVARDILVHMLKNINQHPYVEQAVLESVQPMARNAALDAIRKWSDEKATPLAEEAARKVILDNMQDRFQSQLQTTVLAGIRVLLENKLASNPQLSADEREKILKDYMSDEAKKTAAQILTVSMTAELRRMAQTAAEQAIASVASQATDAIAREDALNVARVVAVDTAKAEIARLILAESQRRAAKMTREKLQEEAPQQPEDKRAEYCQQRALVLAREAVQSVNDEIAEPSVAGLDLDKALELAMAASTAVAREFSGGYQMTSEECDSGISKTTVLVLAAQILLGCGIVWFFLLGGYEVCQPALKKILSPAAYRLIYKPEVIHTPVKTNDKNSGDIDELLEDPKSKAPDLEGADDLKPPAGDSEQTPATDMGQSPDSGAKQVPASGANRQHDSSSKHAPAAESEQSPSAGSKSAPDAESKDPTASSSGKSPEEVEAARKHSDALKFLGKPLNSMNHKSTESEK